MADVEIGEISTRVEIIERPMSSPDELQRLVETVIQRLREAAHNEQLREQDGRIRDRSWKSDVKPD
jgi:hypothetical protein